MLEGIPSPPQACRDGQAAGAMVPAEDANFLAVRSQSTTNGWGKHHIHAVDRQLQDTVVPIVRVPSVCRPSRQERPRKAVLHFLPNAYDELGHRGPRASHQDGHGVEVHLQSRTSLPSNDAGCRARLVPLGLGRLVAPRRSSGLRPGPRSSGARSAPCRRSKHKKKTRRTQE